MGRTQQGNNNAYCQDNAISWLSWELKQQDQDLLAFTGVLSVCAKSILVPASLFFSGTAHSRWRSKRHHLAQSGWAEMSDEDWNQAFSRCLGVYFDGGKLLETDGRGRRLMDNNLLLLINAHYEDIAFTLPEFDEHSSWMYCSIPLMPQAHPKYPATKSDKAIRPWTGMVLLKQGKTQ